MGSIDPGYETDFAQVTDADLLPSTVCVTRAAAGTRLRHQQVASLLRHTSGQLLLACRWDATGFEEGDASNEQALYFSRDGGRSWVMANGGEPIVTLAQGSGFATSSAITHAFAYQTDDGATWLAYTINQPFTWGADRPRRSTGGGEIRRLRISFDGQTWRSAGPSEVLWGFRAPLDDGCGGTWHDLRLLSLNGVLRLRSGVWLMPVAGRSTVDDPQGAYWRLNRAWVLASHDGGHRYRTSHFIGGGDALAVCEPTILETACDDHVVAFMRVQYETGDQLQRSDSFDGGRSWSWPRPVGLPNTGTSGTKPYARRLADGRYALLQTNEHERSDRTNMSLFLTDEDGLMRDRWKLVRTLGVDARQHWQGSAYGWLEEDGRGGLLAAWVAFDTHQSRLVIARFDDAWLARSLIDPNGVRDVDGDDLPHLVDAAGAAPGRALRFPNVRGRAVATRFGALQRYPQRVDAEFEVRRTPRNEPFLLLQLRADGGRHPSLTVALRPAVNQHLWVLENRGWIDTGVATPTGRWQLMLELHDPRRATLHLPADPARGAPATGTVSVVTPSLDCLCRTTNGCDSLWIGGGLVRDDCEVLLTGLAYGEARQREVTCS